MGNPKKMIKVMTVTTVVVAVLATLSGVTMMVNASWVNILATACSVISAFTAMLQLLLVKQAYIGYKDPDEDEE